jgi:signal-transduction protein with cAMP-binding, CBS, and nucleotidyltransferase domain
MFIGLGGARVDYIEVFMSGGDREAEDNLLLPAWTRGNWQELLSRTQSRSYHSSEVVIQRGVSDRSLDGLSISPLAKIHAGSVIGEQSFFDAHPRSANVWAVTDGELLCLPFREFEKFADEEPLLARDLLFALGRVLSLRLRNTTGRVRR